MSFLGFLKKTTDYTGLIPKAELMNKKEVVSTEFSGNININGTGESIDKFVVAEYDRDYIIRAFKAVGFDVFPIDYSVSGQKETHALHAPNHLLSSFLKQNVVDDLTGKFGGIVPIITAVTGNWINQRKEVMRNDIVEITLERKSKTICHLGDFLKSNYAQEAKGELIVPLGQGKEPTFIDLTTMPHLLVAGTTGSGKSEFQQNLLLSLHYRYTREDVQIALIDGKGVELNAFENSPLMFFKDEEQTEKAFYIQPEESIDFISWMVGYMERRYRIMNKAKVKNIEEYNAKFPSKKMPRILLIIDEFNKMVKAKDSDNNKLFEAIGGITEAARASGIILILATQTPNAKVIPTQVKTNIPCMALFRVGSRKDASNVIQVPEAYYLLGKGDGIFINEQGKMQRFVSTFLDKKVDKLEDVITWDR